MIAALALLLGAGAAGWLIPRRLGRIDLRHRDPLLMIVSWLMSMADVALAAATGVILLLLPGHGGIGSLVGVLHHCWSAVQHGSPPQVEQLGGMLGVIVLAAAAVPVGGGRDPGISAPRPGRARTSRATAGGRARR